MRRLTLLTLLLCLNFAMNANAHLIDTSEISRKLLKDAVLLFNDELRNQASGQYYDAVSLSKNLTETNSSTAATGMGLVSLAIGDATGIVTDARLKSIQTLSTILNPKFSKRHKQGWLRHWFNAQDGQDNAWSAADGYSTIDTAILAAGAVLNSNYFKAKNKDPENGIEDLANQLLQSVNWASAIADMNSGRMYMNYDLKSGAPKQVTSKFNEYILVSCLGKLAESKRGVHGQMTAFWQKHFANPENLPKKKYNSAEGPIAILTDSPFHYLSSFTIQFSYYLCGDVNRSPAYIRYFTNAQKIDQDWFKRQNIKRLGYWGLGAGEAVRGYEANSAFNNKSLIVSPHIVSGFMAESPQLLNELASLYLDKKLIYIKNNKEILWRRSLAQPEVMLSRLQAVDFSTMIFGLASVQPQIGKDFFKSFAAGGIYK
jgi:hypothetical protein